MTILVTGSDGFIGKALSTKLDFVPLDSKRGTRVEWSKPFLEYLKPEVIIHLASHSTVKQTIKAPSEAAENIITNTVRLIEWAKPKHFIYFSSSMVYGNFEDGVKEYDIPQPTNLYRLYKLAAEEAIRLSKINYTIIRPSAVYGRNDNQDRVIPKFIKNAIENKPLTVDGNNKADFTHVNDVVEGILKIINNPKCFKKTYNMTFGAGIYIKYVAKLIKEMTGSKSEIIINKGNSNYPSRGALDNSKIFEDTGWSAKTNIENGLKKLIRN